MTQAELEASVAQHTEEFNEIRAILRIVAQQQAANSQQQAVNSERLTEISKMIAANAEQIAANAEQVAANTTGIVELRALQADFLRRYER
jgi:hypothetical protein